MSGIHNKNLIFYSLYPTDSLSRLCLAELDKNPALNKQFIRICIHHPQDYNKPPLINLPSVVRENRNQIPILAISGFQQPILAKAAMSWLKESISKDENAVTASNIQGYGTADNCATIAQSEAKTNSLFDTDYNLTFSNGIGEFNKSYANIDESAQMRIPTFDESADKKSASQDVAKRLETLKFNRSNDLHTSGNGGQFGGLHMPTSNRQMPQMPQMPAGMGAAVGGGGARQMPQMPSYR